MKLGTDLNRAPKKKAPFDDDLGPLIGKAFYAATLTPTNFAPHYHMVFAMRAHKDLPSKIVPTTVTCRGKTWHMTFYGNSTKRLDIPTWKEFAEENELKVGDALFWDILESNEEKLVMKVQIIKGDYWELEEEEKEMNNGGETPDDPIIIE